MIDGGEIAGPVASTASHAAAREPGLAPNAIDREIEAVETLDLEALRAAWARRFGERPKLRSPELLRLMLAWKIQAAHLGGLDGSVRRQLRRSGGEGGLGAGIVHGARLAREWKGVLEEAQVTAEGYLWRGQTFASLSAVARAITGTRWNGPRFFGLRSSGPSP